MGRGWKRKVKGWMERVSAEETACVKDE